MQLCLGGQECKESRKILLLLRQDVVRCRLLGNGHGRVISDILCLFDNLAMLTSTPGQTTTRKLPNVSHLVSHLDLVANSLNSMLVNRGFYSITHLPLKDLSQRLVLAVLKCSIVVQYRRISCWTDSRCGLPPRKLS